MLGCKIIDVVPDAQYAGTTYTQTALCQIEDNTRLSVFDTTPTIVSENLIGEEISAVLLGRSSEATLSEENDAGIEKLDGDKCRYYGEVVEISSVGAADIEAVLVDIGMGSVYIEPDPALQQLVDDGVVEPGDHLSVNTYRTDIVDFSED